MRLALILCAGLLAGCATPSAPEPEPEAQPAPKPGFTRVAVLSVVGGQLTHVRGGLPLFGDNAVVDIAAWNLDQDYAARLAYAVKSVLRSEVVTPALAPEAVQQINDLGAWQALRSQALNWGAAEEPLRNLAAQAQADGLFVLARGQGRDPATANRVLEGLGLYERLKKHLAFLHAMLFQVDAVTGKPLRGVALSDAYLDHTGKPRTLPSVELPENLQGLDTAALDPAAQTRLRAILVGLCSYNAAERTLHRVLSGKAPGDL